MIPRRALGKDYRQAGEGLTLTSTETEPEDLMRLERAHELAAQIHGSLTPDDRAAMRRDLDEMYDEDGLPA